MKRALVFFLFVVVLLWPARASAHSDQELEQWLAAWEIQDPVALIGAPEGMLLRATVPNMMMRESVWEWALEDMRDRHPCRKAMGTWSDACERWVVPIPSPSPDTNRGMGSGVEQWRGLVSQYDWNVEIALCLMSHESGGNPNAQNRSSGASGLMQVLPSWADNFGYSPADLFIPEVNLAISYALYVDGGWGHWSPWNRGACH